MKKCIGIICVLSLLFVGIAVEVQASAWLFWSGERSVQNHFQSSRTSPGSWTSTPPSTPTTPTNTISNPWSSYWSNVSSYTSPSQPNPVQPTSPQQPVEPNDPVTAPTNPVQPQPSAPLQPQPRKVPAPVSSLTSLERQLIDLVNKERTDRGLNALQIDMTLVQLAKDKSHDMATTGNVSHYSRTQFHANLESAGVSFIQAGENLARAASLQRVHNGLMTSSGHRANILASGYTHIGVGIVQYGTSYYATQIFIRR